MAKRSLLLKENMEDSNPEPTAARPDPQFSGRAAIRCLLAMCCSHLAAPYAAARVTVRYRLEGIIEPTFTVAAAAAIIIGMMLTFRQLIHQSHHRRMLYGLTGIVLWVIVAFVQLTIAVDSVIPTAILGSLWAVGTLWVPWSIWAYAFFRTKGVIIGSVLAVAGVTLLWSIVEISGLTGDARVEISWKHKTDASLDVMMHMPSEFAGDSDVTWSGYLGNLRTARVSETLLMEDWFAHPPQELWRSSCGAGWSSFAATETTLFGQEQLNGEDCVTARDLKSGELTWVCSEGRPGFKSGLGGDGPRASPALYVRIPALYVPATPETPRTLLFAIGPTGLLQCLNSISGEVIWENDLAESFPGENLGHGVCASPLIVDDYVIVCPPAPGGPCMVAFRCSDGEQIWKCDSEWQSSYASPALMKIAGILQIVLHASPGVIAVRPLDGSILWQFEWSNEWDNNATQPLQPTDSSNDLVIATGYRGGAVRLTFEQPDGDILKPREVWKTTSTMKTKFCNMAQFGSVLVGLDKGILCGVDVNTGKRLWKDGRYAHGQILQCGSHLLVMAERGTLHLLKPDADGHQPLASHEIFERKTWTHPIMVDDLLIIRNDREIVCLRLPTDR